MKTKAIRQNPPVAVGLTEDMSRRVFDALDGVFGIKWSLGRIPAESGTWMVVVSSRDSRKVPQSVVSAMQNFAFGFAFAIR